MLLASRSLFRVTVFAITARLVATPRRREKSPAIAVPLAPSAQATASPLVRPALLDTLQPRKAHILAVRAQWATTRLDLEVPSVCHAPRELMPTPPPLGPAFPAVLEQHNPCWVSRSASDVQLAFSQAARGPLHVLPVSTASTLQLPESPCVPRVHLEVIKVSQARLRVNCVSAVARRLSRARLYVWTARQADILTTLGFQSALPAKWVGHSLVQAQARV